MGATSVAMLLETPVQLETTRDRDVSVGATSVAMLLETLAQLETTPRPGCLCGSDVSRDAFLRLYPDFPWKSMRLAPLPQRSHVQVTNGASP